MGDQTSSTLLEELRKRFPEASNTTLRTMLASDRVRVNGSTERNAKRIIAPDDRVEIASRHTRMLDPRVRIVYEDSDLVVIDKAAGLLTVPSPEVRHETAETFLNAHYGGTADNPHIHHVHRLDRDTSGVLVFARNTFVRDRLRELFEAHDIERVYVAIVHGKLREQSGTIRSFLAEDHNLRVRSVADSASGREAITHYRTVASGRRFSILELRLETGRRNQIRVQLSEAGHPVVGDTMYGRGREDGFGRLALHATSVEFVHPRSGERMSFSSPVPRAFRELKL